jgi:uncharacterized protein YecE (DUF72 family)
MKNWWIGCSGFYYKGWRDKFYPPKLPQKKWFEYYCEFFNTVELNVTFYRFPKPEALQSWYLRSPQNFRFTVKAPRLITHYKRFNQAFRETQDFYQSVAEGLKEKLGTILFQLHPGIVYTDENLEKILQTLDTTSFQNVLEFRHESWWNTKVIKTLKDKNITFCAISYPGLPDDVVRSNNVMYYRFHGIPKLYLSSYSDEELETVASSIHRLRKLTDVYCYFNNDIEVAAIYNGKKLREIAANLTGESNFSPSFHEGRNF